MQIVIWACAILIVIAAVVLVPRLIGNDNRNKKKPSYRARSGVNTTSTPTLSSTPELEAATAAPEPDISADRVNFITHLRSDDDSVLTLADLTTSVDAFSDRLEQDEMIAAAFEAGCHADVVALFLANTGLSVDEVADLISNTQDLSVDEWVKTLTVVSRKEHSLEKLRELMSACLDTLDFSIGDLVEPLSDAGFTQEEIAHAMFTDTDETFTEVLGHLPGDHAPDDVHRLAVTCEIDFDDELFTELRNDEKSFLFVATIFKVHGASLETILDYETRDTSYDESDLTSLISDLTKLEYPMVDILEAIQNTDDIDIGSGDIVNAWIDGELELQPVVDSLIKTEIDLDELDETMRENDVPISSRVELLAAMIKTIAMRTRDDPPDEDLASRDDEGNDSSEENMT